MIRTLLMTLLLLSIATAQVKYGSNVQIGNSWLYYQPHPSIVALKSGGFVVCSEAYLYGENGDYNLTAKQFDAPGNVISEKVMIDVWEITPPENPHVAGLAGGGYIVCWVSAKQTWDSEDIFGRRFSASGEREGEVFRVNSYYGGIQNNPQVTALIDGGFAVCWQSYRQDGDDWGIFAKSYNADGKPLNGEFQVNSSTNAAQFSPSIAPLDEGGFLVCWLDNDKYLYEILSRRFDASGHPLGEAFRIATDSDPERPSVARHPTGGFEVFWQAPGFDTRKVIARHYRTFEEILSTTSINIGDFCNFVAAPLADSRLIVCWTGLDRKKDRRGVFAELCESSGEPIVEHFKLDDSTIKDYSLPSVAQLTDGDIVVCWSSKSKTDQNWRIFAKRFPSMPRQLKLSPFALVEPKYDVYVKTTTPILRWRSAIDQAPAFPSEISYLVQYDTLPDFTTMNQHTVACDTSLALCRLTPGKTLFWRIRAKNYFDESQWSDTGAFFVAHEADTTGNAFCSDENSEEQEEERPSDFYLHPNYPNPFNPTTTIRFELPEEGFVKLKIYDIAGRLVKMLLCGEQTAGEHAAVWDGADDAGKIVAAGVYLCRLEFTAADGERQVLTRKMSLVK
jgi:hypothetical protein